MAMKIEGELRIVADGCTSSEMGIDAARLLLCLVVDPMRAQNAPSKDMQALLLGLLVGAVGHFGSDLNIEQIHEQLDSCKRMVLEVPGFMRSAQMESAGRAVH
nr:hypothetical protein [uncultured Acidovorax sp.]